MLRQGDHKTVNPSIKPSGRKIDETKKRKEDVNHWYSSSGPKFFGLFLSVKNYPYLGISVVFHGATNRSMNSTNLDKLMTHRQNKLMSYL